MSRPIVVALAVLGFLQAATAFDLSQTKNVVFTEEDIVPKTALKSFVPEAHAAAGFIGNLEVGSRYPDEIVFRRDIDVNNPTNAVHSITLSVTLPNRQTIHYFSVINSSGSYAVVCDQPTTLGSSKSTVNIRLAANTKAYLTLVIAAH
ncbi:PREDICTED: uncharacterized protein LOC105449166 [Wasmannia auropunctata]|uniref:uncharacterized protein LOC105449166 n=1 Tax=Wasmannia auropunctata TaxID=64793 RepID=UPI0005EEDE96|nr:PREDICTED: uncharacterized protein LOC105449166 [Wasmannia auropunctata]